MEPNIHDDHNNDNEIIILNGKQIKKITINEDILSLKDILIQETLTDSILNYQNQIVDNITELIKHQQN